MKLTTKQQQDLQAFFAYYAEKLENDGDLSTDADTAKKLSLGSYVGWTDKDLYGAIRMFDDYEEVLGCLELDNEDLVDIFWTIRESELAR
jgi:hypothetical protein